MFNVFFKNHFLTKKFFTFLIGSTYLSFNLHKINKKEKTILEINYLPNKEIKNLNKKEYLFNNNKSTLTLNDEQDNNKIQLPSKYFTNNLKVLLKNICMSFENIFYFITLMNRYSITYCETPHMKKPYLGCSIRLDDEEPKLMRIIMIKSDSPAEKAGLKVKDIILEIDGKAIKSINQYNAAVGSDANKKKVKILRKEGEKDIILEFDVEFIFCE